MGTGPMIIAMMLFEKTGKKGYGDVAGEFQILKQVQEPFCDYVETENTEIIPEVLAQLSTMRSEIRSQAMSIMRETYSDKEFLKAIVAKLIQEPFCDYLETHSAEAIEEVFSHLSAMWPEIRSQAMTLLQETYPEYEFLEAIVSHTDLSNEVKWIEEAGFGKVVAEYQILKQIQEPFCD